MNGFTPKRLAQVLRKCAKPRLSPVSALWVNGLLRFRELESPLGGMDAETKTVVTFESTAFNMAEPKDYFINSCRCGDDIAKSLIGELRKQGAENDENPVKRISAGT
jgi:hypothetical protein